MNIGKFVLLTATLTLAMAFTFSCTSADIEDLPQRSVNYMTCSEAERILAECYAEIATTICFDEACMDNTDATFQKCLTDGICGTASSDECFEHYISECDGFRLEPSTEPSSPSIVSSSSRVSSSSTIVPSSSSRVSSSSISSIIVVPSSSSGGGYGLLSNINFEGGVLSPWEIGFGDLSTANRGTINLVDEGWGYDVIFTPSGKETKDWELQLLQRNLDLRSGYSYTITLGGNTTKGGEAQIAFELLNCTTISDCSPYISWRGTLNSTYKEYTGNWDNCRATNSNATFVISGGLSEVEFKIAWIHIWAEPMSCP